MSDTKVAALVEQYLIDQDWSVVPGESGMNNTTRMIHAGSERFVLRVYNNHRDLDIVKLEHSVLNALHQLKPSFKLPVPVANRSGNTISLCSDGALAAMYRYIPGERPQLCKEHIRSLGAMAAELSTALADLSISETPIYDPYYSLEETYSSLIQELPDLMQASQKFTVQADKVAVIQDQLRFLAARLQKVRQLPQQWIHGDLNLSNSVAVGDTIIGVLDFEFCTIDVRAMELAVAMIDFIKGDDSKSWEWMGLFCEGYGSVLKLTGEELEQLPFLIKLRSLDVFLHFTNRWKEGLDEADLLAGFIDQTYRICGWIDRNEKQLQKLFKHQLL